MTLKINLKKILHRFTAVFMAFLLCFTIVVHNTHKVEAIAIVDDVAVVAIVCSLLIAIGVVDISDGKADIVRTAESFVEFCLEETIDIVDFCSDCVSNAGKFYGDKAKKGLIAIGSGALATFAGYFSRYLEAQRYNFSDNGNGGYSFTYSNTMSYDEIFDFMYENINYDGALTPYYNSIDTGLIFFTDESSSSYSSSRNDKHNLKWVRLIKIDYIPAGNGEYYRDCYGYICHTNYRYYNDCIQIFYTYNDDLRCYWNYGVNFISNDYCGFNDKYNAKWGNYTYLTEPIYNTDCNSYIDDLQKETAVKGVGLTGDNALTNDSYIDDLIKSKGIDTDADTVADVIGVSTPVNPDGDIIDENWRKEIGYFNPPDIIDTPWDDLGTLEPDVPVDPDIDVPSGEIGGIWGGIQGLINSLIDFLKGILQSILDAIKGLVAALIAALKGLLSSLFVPTVSVQDHLQQLANNYTTGFKSSYLHIEEVTIPDVTLDGTVYVSNKFLRDNIKTFRLMLDIFISFLYIVHCFRKGTRILGKGGD